MNRGPDWRWWDETRAVARRQARGAGHASDAADDLAQDLAVAALERGAGASRVGAWLERVGRNARIDRWRVERRRRELAVELEMPAGPPDPEAGVLARERRGVLRRALAALPRHLRRAALARFHADLPYGAVAARLGTREVTARTRVQRALARLRDGLGGLRVVFAPWPGAQATVLGLTLVAGVARPALFPVEMAATPVARAATPRAKPQAPAAVPLAATEAAPPAARAPEPARARRGKSPMAPVAVQRFDYGDDRIDGDQAGPDGIIVRAEPVIEHSSLIELRWDLVPEVVKTLEDL